MTDPPGDQERIEEENQKREQRSQNKRHGQKQEQDGHTFYGSDNGDGTTTWYDENGTCDSTTDTPDDEDDW